MVIGWRLRGARLTPDMNKSKKKPVLARPFASHPISRIVRSYVERHSLVRNLAMQGLGLLTFARVAIYPTHAYDYGALTNLELETVKVEIVTTEKTLMFPLSTPTGISQRYNIFHQGIDIRAPKGTPVMAIEEGVIVEVGHLTSGYGENVRIAHKGTVSSLYAHLEKIIVNVGDKVEKGQEIGAVGMSGWTTGPHLHLELSEGQKTVNPDLWL